MEEAEPAANTARKTNTEAVREHSCRRRKCCSCCVDWGNFLSSWLEHIHVL
jgi:hypothetical protein